MASALSNRQNCACARKTLQTQRGRTHGAGCVRQWFRTAEPLGGTSLRELEYTHTFKSIDLLKKYGVSVRNFTKSVLKMYFRYSTNFGQSVGICDQQRLRPVSTSVLSGALLFPNLSVLCCSQTCLCFAVPRPVCFADTRPICALLFPDLSAHLCCLVPCCSQTHLCFADSQTRQLICAVWSEPLLFPYRVHLSGTLQRFYMDSQIDLSGSNGREIISS